MQACGLRDDQMEDLEVNLVDVRHVASSILELTQYDKSYGFSPASQTTQMSSCASVVKLLRQLTSAVGIESDTWKLISTKDAFFYDWISLCTPL